ncbi:hypothetical protein EDD15DRAFT_2279617 [Pisolithus albus]|nr:hypothetical protein EDD15DRAFT_2279617 [Pisolithus albus]
MGGGARYPYPKHVWTPSGGWWSRPANWKSNTAITFAGILAVAYGVWTVSAEREVGRCLVCVRWVVQQRGGNFLLL